MAVKLRWKLKVNRPEKRKLTKLASTCKNTTLRWKPAKVVLAGGGGGGGSNLNAERVKIKNVSGTKKNLTGWKLIDEAGATYRFPTFTLKAGESVGRALRGGEERCPPPVRQLGLHLEQHRANVTPWTRRWLPQSGFGGREGDQR